MEYADFTLVELTKRFNLSIEEDIDLFVDVPPVTLSTEFRKQLDRLVPLALKVSTEKARSEFIIAPILAELWMLTDRKIGLLSGVEFSVDPALGLAGTCDYIITRSPELLFVTSPVLMLVEAKNEEMKRGYAQCVAEMLAAQTFNERDGNPIPTVYGAVTIGELWKFLELTGTSVRIDLHSYHIEHVEKIMGILLRLVAAETTTPLAAG